MPSARVDGFLPSTGGLRFANDFPKVPMVTVPIPGHDLQLGDASNGLCGGMAFMARDLFDAKLQPPAATTPPGSGPLFDFIVQRLFASFDLPDGPTRYLLWMGMPDGDALFGIHGVVWRTMTQEWPAIKKDLDAGVLCPLGLVRIRSFDAKQLGVNHQVLAYGYDLDEGAGTLAVWVYDPNFPGNDAVAIRVALKDPVEASTLSYVDGDRPVRGFFRTAYAAPPAADLAAAANAPAG